jgi:RimJ/RimL family protein N-acetyltransferase
MFASWVESAPGFEILAPARFGVVCFRLNNGRAEDGLTELNKTFLERLNASGKIHLSHTVLNGRYTLRMVIGQRLTAERHVRAAWDLIRRTGADLLRATRNTVVLPPEPRKEAPASIPAPVPVFTPPPAPVPPAPPKPAPPIVPPPPPPVPPPPAPSLPLPETPPKFIPKADPPPPPAAPPKPAPKPAAPESRPPKAARNAHPEPIVPKAAPVREPKPRPLEKTPAPPIPQPLPRMILSGSRLELVFCDLDLIEMILYDKTALAGALNAAVPEGWPVSPEVQPLFRDMIREDPSARGWLGYAAILRSERQVIGDIGFLGPPDPAGNVEIGYAVVSGRRGRGYASEMVGVLIRWAFEDERVRRITAHTDPDNAPSIKVLEKNGFQRDGTSAFLDEGDKIAWTLERGSARFL